MIIHELGIPEVVIAQHNSRPTEMNIGVAKKDVFHRENNGTLWTIIPSVLI